MNAVLRKIGLKPSRPARFPVSNRVKAIGWRALRRTPIGARIID
jgi:hypothetical protein